MDDFGAADFFPRAFQETPDMDPLSQLRNSDLHSQCRHATMSNFDLHPPTTKGISQYSDSTRQQQFHYSVPGSSSLEAYYLQSRDLPRANEAPWHMQGCSGVQPLEPGVEKGSVLWNNLDTRDPPMQSPLLDSEPSSIRVPPEMQRNRHHVESFNSYLSNAFAAPSSNTMSEKNVFTRKSFHGTPTAGLFRTGSSVNSHRTNERDFLFGGANAMPNLGSRFLSEPKLSVESANPSYGSIERDESETFRDSSSKRVPEGLRLSKSTTASEERCPLERKSKSERKTEQNRQAQARFRKKRKERNSEQEQAIDNLNSKLEKALSEKKLSQDLVIDLRARLENTQHALDQKQGQLQTLTSTQKTRADIEGFVNACWDMFLTLRRGGCKMNYSRQNITEMVDGMLTWGSPTLGFLRRDLKDQLSECLKSGSANPKSSEYYWMCELIEAYENMVHKARKCHPQACTTFLDLKLSEQYKSTPSKEFWINVMDVANLKSTQKAQLVSAHKSLMTKLGELHEKSQEIAQSLNAQSPATSEKHCPLLAHITEGQKVLDLHDDLHNEKQSAIYSFITTFRLVIEPEQYAKLIVAAFPYSLDTPALCDIILETYNN